MAIKLLIGGSPCTYWSIAQKNNREVTANGMGWELFKNYLIAKEKFKPNFFLYENNKSAAQPIKEQISHELGVELMYINSALVSAQNRQRFYAFNWSVEQPEDRCIMLKDILETDVNLTGGDKSFCLTASYNGACAWNTIERNQRTMVAEPVIFNTPHGFNRGGIKYDKSPTLTANGSWEHNNKVISPIRVGSFPRPNGELSQSQAMRIYSVNSKSVTLSANGGGMGGKTGLYAVPIDNTQTRLPIYEVKNKQIEINGKTYPINLTDGYYYIRKLTVNECCRLQTMPDNYCKAVSNTQAYKALGNGWTAEVIIHILSGILKNIPRDEEIIVLSLYDGIGTGRYCLDKMGFTNVKYHAYEIDKYPIQIALDNYPDIIQHGDAFAVRNDDWEPPQTQAEWLDEILEV